MKFSTTTSALVTLSLASLSLAQTTIPIPNPNPDTPTSDDDACTVCATLLDSPDACSPAWAEQVAACIAPPCNRDFAADPLAGCLPTDTASAPGASASDTGSMTIQPTTVIVSITTTPTTTTTAVTDGDEGSMSILPTDSISVPGEPLPTLSVTTTTTTTAAATGGVGGNETATVTTSGTAPPPTGSDEPEEGAAAGSLTAGAGMGVVGAFVVAGLVGLVL